MALDSVVGGTTLTLPIILLLGIVLRLPVLFLLPPTRLATLEAEPTYFPLELTAFEAQPALLIAQSK